MWRWERNSLVIKIKNKNRGLKTAAEISQKKKKKRKEKRTQQQIIYLIYYDTYSCQHDTNHGLQKQ